MKWLPILQPMFVPESCCAKDEIGERQAQTLPTSLTLAHLTGRRVRLVSDCRVGKVTEMIRCGLSGFQRCYDSWAGCGLQRGASAACRHVELHDKNKEVGQQCCRLSAEVCTFLIISHLSQFPSIISSLRWLYTNESILLTDPSKASTLAL